jgi:hypothetical protein
MRVYVSSLLLDSLCEEHCELAIDRAAAGFNTTTANNNNTTTIPRPYGNPNIATDLFFSVNLHTYRKYTDNNTILLITSHHQLLTLKAATKIVFHRQFPFRTCRTANVLVGVVIGLSPLTRWPLKNHIFRYYQFLLR